ncbi:hypothetical protein SEUCBS140593_000092 [Sporothrix eucalyptigena]|uniref:GP-PDE domain-containing protein n=1 Tax=Sporothrix eucalyptigena TaxID=1812306 RepID=A0ABP0AK18_9PEZI
MSKSPVFRSEGVSSSSSPSSSPASRIGSPTTPITPITPITPMSPLPEPMDPSKKQLQPAMTSSPLPSLPTSGAPASLSQKGVRLPQNIAHRGFRAKFPENSMAAFRGALESGAAALETDVHLTKDKVIVLSHDPTLKRCFGRTEKIADCDWSFIETLRTTKDPNVPMARLTDLLEFLSEPGRENVWVLLDIKRDDDAEELVTRMAETILATPGDWSKRIILGCWEAKYMRFSQDKLPGFPIAYIGFSLAYSYELLKYDCVSYFNLLQGVLVGPRGARFIREARARGRGIFVWTVNSEEWMDWSIRKSLDGVITDDPSKFAAIRKRWEDDGKDDDKEEGSEDYVSETTPLRRSVDKALPTAHPPNTKTITGFFLRRWAKLYAIVGFLRLLEQVITNIMRYKYGWEGKRIRECLDR